MPVLREKGWGCSHLALARLATDRKKLKILHSEFGFRRVR